MKRAPLLAAVLIVSLVRGQLAAAAADAPVLSDIGRNAALIYWQAFERFDHAANDEIFTNALNEFDTVVIDGKIRAFLKNSAPLTLLRLAAAVDPCDWGIGMLMPKQGPYVLLPHLAKCRSLARLAMLQARVHLIDKQPGKAVDILLDVYRLARHSQSGDVIIGQLVGIAIDQWVHQFISNHFADFDDAAVKILREKYADLPAMAHPKVTVASERDSFGGWIKSQVGNLGDSVTRELLFAILIGPQKDDLVKLAGEKPQKLVALVDDMMKMYDPLTKMLELQPGEFRPAFDAWTKDVDKSNNALAKMVIPAYGSVHETYHRSLAQGAMMHALLTLRLEGRAAFDAIKDPYGDGPFAVKTTDDGIELSSKLVAKVYVGRLAEQPVTLKVKWKPAK